MECCFGFGAVGSFPAKVELKRRQCMRRRGRVQAQVDVNGGDALRRREEDVADKIARLKKMKRDGVKYDRGADETPPIEDPEPTSLETQIADAERFFGVNVDSSAAPNTTATDQSIHVPKVQTWGVFPRPENISKAYGGGRKIDQGGEVESPEQLATREAKTRALLGSYRAGMGIDMEREERCRDAVEAALKTSRAEMLRGRPIRALGALEPFKEEVSPKSSLGGELWINLGLVLEAMGRTEEAKKIYAECRKSPIALVSSRAKELSFGFDAMATLQMDAPARGGLRTIQFDLGDIASYTGRRYDTTFYEKQKQKQTRRSRDAPRADLLPLAAIGLGMLVGCSWLSARW